MPFSEKLYIDDGKFIYKYVSQLQTENQPCLSNTLPYLPETNTEEYVRNWCTSHTPVQKSNRNRTYTVASDDCDSIGSSLQESFEADSKAMQFENVTFRGIQYQKESRNINIGSSCRKLSRESGILTLPDSSIDYTEIDDMEKLSAVDTNNQNSNYFTCDSENSNTSDGLDSTTQENSLNVAKIGKDLLTSSETSLELSYVTVSEWYKYTDTEEGVTLFEKRLLKGISRYGINKNIICQVRERNRTILWVDNKIMEKIIR